MKIKTKKRQTLKAGYTKNEFPASFFIPYEGHVSSKCIISKNKDLMMVIKVQGYAFETADDEDVDMKKTVRNTLFKSVAGDNYSLWFHTIRKKQSVDVPGEFEGTFCQFMDEEWEKKHSNAESFGNNLYITVIQKNKKQGAAKIESLFVNAMNKGDTQASDAAVKASVKDLEEVVNRLLGSLKEYKPSLLGIRETENGTFSEIFEFLGMIVNCGEHTNMLVPTSNAAKYLPTNRLYFGKRAIESRGPTGKSRFTGCISIKEYANYTAAGLLDTFLQLPFEFIISQSFDFYNRGSAINTMSLQQRRMSSAGDKAISLAEELTTAMDMAMSGHIGFGRHHLTIFVFEDSLKRLEDALSLCYAELVNVGIAPSRESNGLQACFWAQLPGNLEYIARKSVINTLNLAGFCSLHNYPMGKRVNNHWGPAVTVFDTTSGTPFFFSFHVRDVGHTTIIGPTGAGKTVLMNFLMAQAQKFKPRMFFFDKDRGAEIFIRAIDGVYNIIDPGGRTGFNPLQLPDTPENRTFLSEWLKSMALAAHNVEITPEESERISEAIAGNYKLPEEERVLHNIIPFLGLEIPGSLAGRIKMWHGSELRAGLFDNAKDNLDFSKSRVFGFEMAKVLADGKSLAPVLLYLFHKINLSLDGTPTIIVLDEAWALIDNEIFAPKIKDWLKVLRKLNAMVVFATQSVEDLSKSAISDTLVQQSATQIFLPNQKATDEYKRTFMLSDREFTLIKTTNPGSRFFLVKQGSEVVVARIDLSGMDKVISVLSGRAETVLLLDEIRSEVGDKPENWLPEYYRRLKELA